MWWLLVRFLLARNGLALLAAVALAASVSAQDAGVPAGAASNDAPPATPPADLRVARVRALIGGSLEVSVSPESLFDVDLSDEPAVQVEAARIRALLRAAREATLPPEPSARPRARLAPSVTPDAGTLRADLEAINPALWSRRLDLDRARLAFYALSQERRGELLRTHSALQEASRPRESDEERRATESAAEQQRALEAAKAARTEAERLVAEELARMIALEASVATVRGGIRDAEDQIALRRDIVLGWQRRVRDAKAANPADGDATYDALRRTLRSSRDDLSAALDALGDDGTGVPALGADALVDVPPDIPADLVRQRRSSVERDIAAARREERDLREERASALLDEITSLNRERLGLLPYLSSAKRDAITGFTAAGWDQARSEARHLTLVLRYHQHAARAWLRSLRTSGSAGISPWKAAALAVPLLMVVITFLWGRRRSKALLKFAETRIGAADRAEHRTSASLARRAVRVLSKTHRPLEWILLFAVTMWLLPGSARDLLEIQLISSVAGWILAGALIVNLINALASGSAGALLSFEDDTAGHLRLRSLRLVGRTVVVFALILVLSSRLVGQGSIYSWVFSTCWFAAIPVFLQLVRWWRGTVFQRMGRARRKTPLQTWILANRAGWKSFLAAMIGALQLFGTGALKTTRGWLSGFDVARRAHAYLFRREIERLDEGQTHAELVPLDSGVLEALHPERQFTRWIACPSDQALAGIHGRISERRGGLFAIVGPRGMGKSSLLRALAEKAEEGVIVTCTSGTVLFDIRKETGADQGSPRSSGVHQLVLLDDAHALVRPSIGGLALFDEMIALARSHGRHATWVFAIDASLWPLLKRARDARPIFDEIHTLAPWNETQIGALISDRCERAQISPTYEDLLEKLPPGSDEIDRLDALKAKQVGYERMLWDHVGGNPALALEAWRASVGQDAAGVVHVRALRVPDVSTLERLPDSSLFILRAVLQLAPASVEAVADATRMRPEEVLQDFRFGQAHGFFSEHEGHVRVAWPWLRAITRLLERRHLLVIT